MSIMYSLFFCCSHSLPFTLSTHTHKHSHSHTPKKTSKPLRSEAIIPQISTSKYDRTHDAYCSRNSSKFRYLCVKEAMSPMEVCEGLGLYDLKNRKRHMQGTCALRGDGLYEGLDCLANTLKEHRAAGFSSVGTFQRFSMEDRAIVSHLFH